MKHIGSAASKSKLTNVQDDDVQPNAVDLRIAKVLQIQPAVFEISEDLRLHRGSVEIEPDSEGWWHLAPGSYEVVMENIITVGAGEAGFVITRSSLNRNGVFLTSGLYDSGYNGTMAACMHVNVASIKIQRGTRIGQYLSFEAETLSLYDGVYGIGKEHDKKYGV